MFILLDVLTDTIAERVSHFWTDIIAAFWRKPQGERSERRR